MPWEVKRMGNKAKPWCVVKKGTSEVVGCSKTSAMAQKHIAALYANTKETSDG